MGRIRTVKPGLFKHEGLYDLEEATGLPVRLAFIGLFTQADREGRFKWTPRSLKTDVMPYDDIDFSRVLDALVSGGFLVKYSVDGKLYGQIATFTEHQAINGREQDSTLPGPDEATDSTQENNEMTTRQSREDDASSTRHDPARGEKEGKGKGREEEKEGKGREIGPPPEISLAVDRYNRLAAEIGLPIVQKLTAQRKQKLRRRLEDCGGVGGWDMALEKIRGSPFLRGDVKDWKADFDFLLQEKSFTKLMEGGYDPPPPEKQKQQENQSAIRSEDYLS